MEVIGGHRDELILAMAKAIEALLYASVITFKAPKEDLNNLRKAIQKFEGEI